MGKHTATIPADAKGVLKIACKAVDDQYNQQPHEAAPIWNLRGILNTSWGRVNAKVGEKGMQISKERGQATGRSPTSASRCRGRSSARSAGRCSTRRRRRTSIGSSSTTRTGTKKTKFPIDTVIQMPESIECELFCQNI